MGSEILATGAPRKREEGSLGHEVGQPWRKNLSGCALDIGGDMDRGYALKIS
jgi:hypothetical protein